VERLTYFLITRKLFDSAIWRDDPHLLKLFIYLIGMARHKKDPKKFPGFEVKRGEIITSLAQIADDNEYRYRKSVKKWGRMQVSRMLHRLEVYGYISLLRYSYGIGIKVCNYDTYQSQETYKKEGNVTTLLRQRYDNVTSVLPYNNGKNGNNVKNELKRPNKKTFGHGSVPVILSELLLSFINSRNGNFRKPDIQKWAADIDKMIRIDRRIPCGIMNVICWSQADEFWQNNILSAGKLRKQYDQLRMKMLSVSNLPKAKQKQLKNAAVSREWLENGK